MATTKEPSIALKGKGYKRKLTAVQIVEAARMATEGACTPQIAHQYNITICEAIGLVLTECGRAFIKFQKYGNAKLTWQ